MVFALPAAPLELPLELPEPMLPLLEPELPVLGEVGVVLELLPVPALEPDLLKCASHSEREICPSLLVSTDEKLGLDELLLEPDMPLDEPDVLDPELEPPDAALPLEDLSDVPDELEPEAAGADDELLPDAEGEDDDELCATAILDSANSAAAVAALRTLSFSIRCLLEGGVGRECPHPPCKPRAPCGQPRQTASMLLPSGSSANAA